MRQFSKTLFMFEQRIFVERAIRDEISQNKAQYFDTVSQLAKI